MKKIIISSLILITLLSMFYNCFAFEIGKKDLISLGHCEVYITHKGVEKHTDYVVYQKDGVYYPAYCVDPTLNGVGTGGVGNYSVDVDSRFTNTKLWRAIVNGYPYKSLAELGVEHEHEAFTATKWAVYTMMYNRDLAEYAPVDTDAGRRTYNALVKIVNAARNSTEYATEYISILSDNQNWNVDNINKELVSKTYTISSGASNGTYKINVDGNLPKGLKLTDINNIEKSEFSIGEKFKILIPIKNLLENNNFTIKAKANLKSKPVLYGKTAIEGTQNYALTGYMYEDFECSYTERYSKNLTKLVITKKEAGTDKKLEGVKFNLLDENKNVVLENLITDENGKISIENMLPGKYYISETETLKGYNLYIDLIEVNLDYNEEFEVVVNNSMIEKTEVNKLNENVEVSSKSTENVYNVENVSTITKENNVENKTIINNTKNVKKLPVTGY